MLLQIQYCHVFQSKYLNEFLAKYMENNFRSEICLLKILAINGWVKLIVFMENIDWSTYVQKIGKSTNIMGYVEIS